MKSILIFILILVFSKCVLAIQSDYLYMALPPNSLEQIEVILPDDAGVILPGKIEYRVTLEPMLPNESWADFSEQIVRTDENNTVVIPIHFSTFGKKVGECSEPFTLKISSLIMPERVINGRVCVSKYKDVDTGNDDVNEIDGVELFDMKLSKLVQYGVVGERLNMTLMLQSHANLTIELNVEGDIDGVLERRIVYLNNKQRFQTVGLGFEPKMDGIYRFKVIGRVKNCNDVFCWRSVNGKLVVKKERIGEKGFTISLFPENINLKSLEEVEFRLTIVNYGNANSFNVNLDISYGLETNFIKRVVFVEGNSEETLRFIVTPKKELKLYKITAIVRSGNIVKRATSYISTNEMLTDALRGVEMAKDKKMAENEVDKWYSIYKHKDYGSGLDDYSELKKRLKEGRYEKNEESMEEGGKIDISIFFIPIIIVVLMVIGIVIYFFKIRENEEIMKGVLKLRDHIKTSTKCII